MTRFERAFRRRYGDLAVTGYTGLPQGRGEATAFLLAHLRSLGCDCHPEVTLPALPRRGELTEAEIAHDPWCALLRRMGGGW